MPIRGIRGATSVAADDAHQILLATRELVGAMMAQNPRLRAADVASAIFTLTEDLSSAYPAQAARDIGWDSVPLLCAREIPVPGSLPRVIRVLVHWNTDMPQSRIRHVYLREAAALRPDLAAAHEPVQPIPGGTL